MNAPDPDESPNPESDPKPNILLDLALALGIPDPGLYTNQGIPNSIPPRLDALGEWPAIRHRYRQLFNGELDSRCLAEWNRLVDWVAERRCLDQSVSNWFNDLLAVPLADVAELLRREVDALAAKSNQHRDGHVVPDDNPLLILSPDQEAVLTILQSLPEGKGLTGPKIIQALANLKPKIVVAQNILTTRIMPVLKEHYGVRNDGNHRGYYISPNRRGKSAVEAR